MRSLLSALPTYALSAVFVLITNIPAAGELELRIEKDGFSIERNGNVVTSLRTDYRIPYLYPLISTSGANVARNWPMENHLPDEDRDHPHHRGFWTAHGNVNGFDFWADEKGQNAKITLVKVEDITETPTHLTVKCTFIWSGGKLDLLSEQRQYTFSYPTAETLQIDSLSILSPIASQITFGDTKEGTVAFRTDRTLRTYGPVARAQLITSEGAKNDAAWGQRGQWAAYEGPDELGEPTVIAMLCLPDSFRYPTYWHARGYGLIAANPFGIHDFTKSKDKNVGEHVLLKDESLRLHHTVIIHHGELSSIDLSTYIKSEKP